MKRLLIIPALILSFVCHSYSGWITCRATAGECNATALTHFSGSFNGIILHCDVFEGSLIAYAAVVDDQGYVLKYDYVECPNTGGNGCFTFMGPHGPVTICKTN